MDETTRLAKRQEIREGIARAGVLKLQFDALNDEITRLQAVIDAQADVHSETCGPLQDELSKLEADAVQRIASRQPADEVADARRREILAEISRQNAMLETVRNTQQALIAPLQHQAAKLRNEMATIPTSMILSNESLGNPQLLCQKFSLSRRVEFLAARRDSAAKQLEAARGADKLAGTNRTPKWECELKNVAAELEAARKEVDSVIAQLIEE